jgi:hypothetical protein
MNNPEARLPRSPNPYITNLWNWLWVPSMGEDSTGDCSEGSHGCALGPLAVKVTWTWPHNTLRTPKWIDVVFGRDRYMVRWERCQAADLTRHTFCDPRVNNSFCILDGHWCLTPAPALQKTQNKSGDSRQGTSIPSDEISHANSTHHARKGLSRTTCTSQHLQALGQPKLQWNKTKQSYH